MRIPVLIRRPWRAACAGVLLTLAVAIAQDPRHGSFLHSVHDSILRMNAGMDGASITGDPDRDFALMMTPQHQCAIDMAKAELNYGKDPVMRRLAQEIITNEQAQIEAMQLWLNHGIASNARK
jgi:uncharacterized protein (DUF305 family)